MPKLKELRERACITQGELAQKAGVSRFTVNQAETGMQIPRMKTRRKLAKALKVKPQDIEF